MLKIENLTKKSFNNPNENIIDNLNLELDTGEIVIITGSSGVGKSTLLRVLAGLDNYQAGSFFLKNKKWLPGKAHQGQDIGLVLQEYNCFSHLTVLDNIILPLNKVLGLNKKEAQQLALQWLQKLNIEHCALSYPEQLSGGQKQRVAIARAIALSPKILCMDEPTAALDYHSTGTVAELIKSLSSDGRSLLVSTHDQDLTRLLSEVATILVMANGKLTKF